jgi:hephaestin
LAAPAAARTRTYYLAAQEVQWNYAPGGVNKITGQKIAKLPADFLGWVYTKAQYVQFADRAFSKPVAKPAYFGIMGPVIRAEVGDTIVVYFKNETRFPQSMHPHGVLYDKSSEGAPYSDGVTKKKGGDSVAPGATFRYVWHVPPRAGPARMDESSVLWMYHSHVDEVPDISAGLIGPMVISRKGMARADGSPKDVDREVFAIFALDDENQSVYMPENLNRSKRAAALPVPERFNPFGDFYPTNEIPSINFYVYGTMPIPVLRVGQRVRWYLMADASDAFDIHVIHWHGNDATANGMRTDAVQVLPAGMAIADMVPDNPGTWLFHCHVNFHLEGGMIARYQVVR